MQIDSAILVSRYLLVMCMVAYLKSDAFPMLKIVTFLLFAMIVLFIKELEWI